jgi:hypothetical protein
MDERIVSSYHQEEESLEEVIQINQISRFVTSPPELLHVNQSYLRKEKEETTNKVVSQIIGFVKRVEDPKSKRMSPLTEENLESEKTLVAQRAYEGLLRYVHKVLTPLCKEN